MVPPFEKYFGSVPGMDGAQEGYTVVRATVLFVRPRVKKFNFVKVQPYNFRGCYRIIFGTSKGAPINQKFSPTPKNRKILSINHPFEKFSQNQPKNRKILSKSTKNRKILSKSIKNPKNLSIQ